MATRIIQSPGVQISEVDLTLQAVSPATTTIYIPGFASQGPINVATNIASITDFTSLYGLPTNGAERYFYNTVNACLQSPADILVTRLPYGQTSIDKNGVLAFPAVYLNTTNGCGNVSAFGSNANGTDYQQTSGVYVLGAPVHYSLTNNQFQAWQQGNLFTYSPAIASALDPTNINALSSAALIIGNTSTSVIDGAFEGLYISICDNVNLDPTEDFLLIRNIHSLSASDTFTTLSPARLGIPLTGTNNAYGSFSQIFESATVTVFDQSERAFDDSVSIAIWQLNQSTFSNNSIALAASVKEVYQGSLDSHRQINSPNGGPPVSFFIDAVCSVSPTIKVKTNPYLSRLIAGNGYQNNAGNPQVKIRCAHPGMVDTQDFSLTQYMGTTLTPLATSNNAINQCSILGVSGTSTIQNIITSIGTIDGAFALGVYNPFNAQLKQIGNVPAKLQTIFTPMLNSDIYPFDIMCEAGMGTIYAMACANGGIFDDYTYFNIGSAAVAGVTDATGLYANNGFSYGNSDPGSVAANNYCAVLDTIYNFNQDYSRKDFLIVADAITNIFVQGNTTKQASLPGATINQNIYTPMANLYSKYNTSYATVYANVVQVNDIASGQNVWIPFSGFAAAAMANTDANFEPWYAPAGFTNGLLNNVLDLAIYPQQKDRDTLYNGGFNPVAFFPGDGFVIYGQKTMLSQPSAFNRINVRRLFLNLEKVVKATLKYFVFQPNTLLTQTSIVNTLTPIFQNAQNTQGLTSYLIICDQRNNTNSVIADNALVVDIYIKPVYTAEYILCNFYATSLSVNFSEITS